MIKKTKTLLTVFRTVRFGDVDAAGVVHFYCLFRWCHEAWEESLQVFGTSAAEIFPGDTNSLPLLEVALPIIHCKADFLYPIKTGDDLQINLLPEKIDVTSFQVKTTFQCQDKTVAFGLIRHVAIDTQTRKRCVLPEPIDLWLESASTMSGKVNPL